MLLGLFAAAMFLCAGQASAYALVESQQGRPNDGLIVLSLLFLALGAVFGYAALAPTFA